VLDIGLFCGFLGGLAIAWAAFGFLRTEQPSMYARRLERVKLVGGGLLIALGSALQFIARL
jgi:multisubunit Na+/H+ antiporter MnhG subunit